jgi:type VI protein secretion system component VasK
MHRVVTLFAIVGWIGAAHSPAAAQNDAQTCARASSDDGAAACRRLLETTVTKDCQQIIAGRYPFVRGARADIPLNDFARLFAPNGVLDNFFKSYLAAHFDTSGQHWTWRQGSANLLSAAALQAFQSAAWIRQAFFRTATGQP